jgi:acyl-coenzyme A thioesterase PaaI-like protein
MNKLTLILRVFGFFKIPLIFFVKPTVVELTETKCVVKIPLNRRTKNHLGSMYFGALGIGADVAGGLHAWDMIEKSKQKISLVFKSFKAEFVKRPEKDVYFICEDGAKVAALLKKVIETGERHSQIMKIRACTKTENGFEDAALFDLELSLKKR